METKGTIELWPGASEDSAHQAWRQIAFTFFKLQRQVEAFLQPRGLVLSQFEAMAKLWIKPGAIQQDLAKALVLTKGNIGALIDRLEDQGWVQRRDDPHDRRTNLLFLTDAGAKLMNDLLGQYREVVHRLMSPLSENQHRQLRALLELLVVAE